MSTIVHSPIVLVKEKEAYAIWFKILADFPKVYRYNLGGKIEDCFLSLLENTFTAIYQSGEKKQIQLSLAIVKLDRLKFFFQLAWENKCIDNKKYTEISFRLNEIGRMIGGWIKGLKTKTPSSNLREKLTSCGKTT